MFNKKLIIIIFAILAGITLVLSGCDRPGAEIMDSRDTVSTENSAASGPAADSTSSDTTSAPGETAQDEETAPPEDESKLELKIWYDAVTKEYMSILVEEFRRDHPEIRVITQDFSESQDMESFGEKLTSDLLTGEGPDIVLFKNCVTSHNSIVNLSELIDSGVFFDINEIGADLSGCNEKVLAGGQYRGGQYIVPLDYSLGFLYTTKERMEKYGIPYGDGITLEEFTAAISEFYNRAPGKYAFADIFTPHDTLYRQNGLSLIDYDKGALTAGKSTTDALKALSVAFDNLFPGAYGDRLLDYYLNTNDYKDGALGAFVSGDLLFLGNDYLGGNYQTLRMLNRAYYESVESGETPRLLPLPQIDGGSSCSPIPDFCLAVPSYTSSKSAAKLFVETAVGFDAQFNAASWYGIPVNDSLVGYIKKWYSETGYHPSEYEFVKWCEFSPSFLNDYFGAVENMKESVFIDVRTAYILSNVFYGVIAEGKTVSALIPGADSALKEYLKK